MEENGIVITNGCPENRLDCAETEQFFIRNGWKIASQINQADIIVLNLCGLLYENELKSLDLIKLAMKKKKENARILVTGCLPKINVESIQRVFKGDIIKGHNIDLISMLLCGHAASEDLSANYIIPLDSLHERKINKVRREMLKGIDPYVLLRRFQSAEYNKYWKQYCLVQPNTFYIKVSSGCVHSCSYCAIKKSRGFIKSKSVNAVRNEFLKGLEAGYDQIALIGTDLGSYGRDIHTDLPSLLRELISIDGKCKLKLRNVHPQLLIKRLNELSDIVQTGKISHITTAVQHGNDRILGLMNRPYHIDDCANAINTLKSKSRNLEIRAQFIVGFPGETHSEFEDTINLIDEINADFFEIYPYSPRIGTLAAELPHQHSHITISRRRYAATKKLLDTLRASLTVSRLEARGDSAKRISLRYT